MEWLLQPERDLNHPTPALETMDKNAVAARLRSLLADRPLVESADRLHVSEHALRLAVDEAAPHPKAELLVAVAHVFGVDPTWLVTGDVNPSTLRAAADGGSDGAEAAIQRLLASGQDLATP